MTICHFNRRTGLLLIACLIVLPTQAQRITGLATKWSDSFVEWSVFTDQENLEGTLRMRFPLQMDWGEWEYRIGEQTGTIRLKWKNDPREWEVRGNNEIVTAQALWRGDFRQWRISGNNLQLTLQTRYGNLSDHWVLRENTAGHWEMYTYWEGDPRDWVVADELDDRISLPMRMALAFIVLYHSSPKE